MPGQNTMFVTLMLRDLVQSACEHEANGLLAHSRCPANTNDLATPLALWSAGQNTCSQPVRPRPRLCGRGRGSNEYVADPAGFPRKVFTDDIPQTDSEEHKYSGGSRILKRGVAVCT